jgi:hypothetical protein
MSARKRPKQTGSDAEAPRFPSGSAKAPLRLPMGTRVAFSRRTTDTSDGAEAMACFHGVVVNDDGDRVDPPSVEHLQLRFALTDALTDGGDDIVWWQNTCDIYEIVAPSFLAAQHTCQGIRCGHFKPTAGAAFLHKVATAKGERARLDADAGRVLDQRAVTLSARVQGILSYKVESEFASQSLRHYLLLHPADLRACNAGFHDMRCTSDATTQERPLFRGAPVGTPQPVRCDYCQSLFEEVVRPQVLTMQRTTRKQEVAAEAAGGGGGSPGAIIGKTRNDLLTRRQVQEKLERGAFEKRRLQSQVIYLKSRNFALIAEKERASAVGGGGGGGGGGGAAHVVLPPGPADHP